jgi:hypothetical protein
VGDCGKSVPGLTNNAKHLLTSLEQLKAGKTQIREFGRKTDLKAKNKELARHSVIAFTDSAWEGYLY